MLASPLALAIVVLAVLAAYVVFSILAFGSMLIGVPLIAHVFSLKLVTPIIVLVDCLASLHQEIRPREAVNRRDLMPLLPFLPAGMAVGATILVRAGVLNTVATNPRGCTWRDS